MRYRITNHESIWDWALYRDGYDYPICCSPRGFNTKEEAMESVRSCVKSIQSETVFSSTGKYVFDGKALINMEESV